MKQLFILLPVLFIFSSNMQAQTANNITGIYYLQGVMETGSGIKLNADSSFEFFYTYGALDRYGTGKWSIENNTIALNSKPYPGKDFKLIGSTNENNNFTTIRIEEKNTALPRFVYCLIKTKKGDSLLQADSHGYIALTDKSADTVHLLFELCPEKISTFTINTAKYDVFTFNFEQWIFEVFFKDFKLQFVKDHLEGRHPLLNDKIYIYSKE
ncbi:MAG TPA: hypothetical protein PLA68_00040 [Panacibacter sp.]|nr:hypothetical protein [Panacibacter sp.]